MCLKNKIVSGAKTAYRKFINSTLVQRCIILVLTVAIGVGKIFAAISVYVKMNNEEQDVKKSIMMIIGACVFLIAAAQALPLFFGIEDGVLTGF